jgi:hypothetical protein
VDPGFRVGCSRRSPLAESPLLPSKEGERTRTCDDLFRPPPSPRPTHYFHPRSHLQRRRRSVGVATMATKVAQKRVSLTPRPTFDVLVPAHRLLSLDSARCAVLDDADAPAPEGQLVAPDRRRELNARSTSRCRKRRRRLSGHVPRRRTFWTVSRTSPSRRFELTPRALHHCESA